VIYYVLFFIHLERRRVAMASLIIRTSRHQSSYATRLKLAEPPP
jgi:hypothetical protein